MNTTQLSQVIQNTWNLSELEKRLGVVKIWQWAYNSEVVGKNSDFLVCVRRIDARQQCPRLAFNLEWDSYCNKHLLSAYYVPGAMGYNSEQERAGSQSYRNYQFIFLTSPYNRPSFCFVTKDVSFVSEVCTFSPTSHANVLLYGSCIQYSISVWEQLWGLVIHGMNSASVMPETRLLAVLSERPSECPLLTIYFWNHADYQVFTRNAA